MLKILSTIKSSRIIKHSIRKLQLNITHRTFLSQAYYCNEVWDHRLENPLLEKVNLDELYHELDQRYQRNGIISAVDVDIFANSVKDGLYVDELLDLTHKLRLSSETTNMLKSTPHAVIRCLFNNNRREDLLNALNDRLNYGLFLDHFTANILMNDLYKSKDFMQGTRIAQQLMLQDELNHPISSSLALLHCYNYLLNMDSQKWPEAEKVEEPEDEVKVRVRYLRNAYDDNHFDLQNPLKIVGKILMSICKNSKETLDRSFYIMGLGLFENHEKAAEIIAQSTDIYQEIIKLLPEENITKSVAVRPQTKEIDIKKQLEERVIAAEREASEKDIASQCDVYQQWEEGRTLALERQKLRYLNAKRIENIELSKKELETKEEKLWFFENEEKIELGIDAKIIYYPKKYFGKKKTPKKIDEGYVPPEI